MTKSQRLLADFLLELAGVVTTFGPFWNICTSRHRSSRRIVTGFIGRIVAWHCWVVEHHSFDVMDKTFVEGACIVRESMLSVNTPFACAMISALCDSPPAVAKPFID